MNNNKNKDVVIVSDSDWDGLWYQTQQLACGFASLGDRVFYLNRTLQRWPTLDHFKIRFFPSKRKCCFQSSIPENVHVITPIWLPPIKILRPINQRLIKNTIAPLEILSPLLITYIPSYNTLDLIKIVNPCKVIYINVHNYDSDVVISDLLKSERELIQKADFLFGDSTYNVERLSRLSNGRRIYPSLPGVNYKLFHQAFRGDEVKRRKTLYYFGGIGSHLDLSIYGALAAILKVVFVGVVDSAVYKEIPSNIEIRPPVANSELPKILQDADMLAIFYKDSPFICGVIPAKFFECLATGKPLLVSGLTEAKPYLDVVYDVQGSEKKALEIIKSLPDTETESRLLKRDDIAKEADWSTRFESIRSKIDL